MKKTLKKVVATALAFSMVLGILPTAYAADNELSSVEIGGVTFDFSVLMKPTYPAVDPATEPTYEDLRERTITLHLTEELTKSEEFQETAPDVTGTTADEWFIADSSKLTDYNALTGKLVEADLEDELLAYEPADDAGVELKEGDIIVLKNDEDNPGYYAFKVSFGNSGAIEGENDVKNAALNVVLPTNLDFSLDPLELTAEQVRETTKASGRIEGSQIKSADYAIINKTGAPVKVAFDLEVVGLEGTQTQAQDEEENDLFLDADGNVTTEEEDSEGAPHDPLYTYPGAVEFVNSPTDIDGKDNDAITTKKIYMAAVGAADSSVIDADNLKFATPTDFTDTAFLYDYTVKDDEGEDVLSEATAGFVVDDTLATNLANKGSTSIAFALGAATDGGDGDGVLDTLAATNGGVTSFSLYGELNTYAKWEGGDINLSGAYTLTALRGTSYTNMIDSSEPDTYKMAAASLNVMKVASATPDESDEPLTDIEGVLGASESYTASSKTEPFTILLPEKPASITVNRTVPSAFTFVEDTHYTYDPNTGIFTNVGLFGSGNSVTFKVTSSGGTYTFVCTVS